MMPIATIVFEIIHRALIMCVLHIPAHKACTKLMVTGPLAGQTTVAQKRLRSCLVLRRWQQSSSNCIGEGQPAVAGTVTALEAIANVFNIFGSGRVIHEVFWVASSSDRNAWLTKENFCRHRPAVCAFELVHRQHATSWMPCDGSKFYWLAALRTGVIHKQVKRHNGSPSGQICSLIRFI
jgi:hypothetical protein